LPNKACVAFKPYELWKEMTDENFVFSLYPGDLVKVTAKKPYKMALVNAASTLDKVHICNEQLLYYIGAGITIATIEVINDDKTYTVKSMGIKSLKLIEKYCVDVLGNFYKVQSEKRQGFQGR